MDLAALEQRVAGLNQQRLELERDKARMAETHRDNLKVMKESYEDERASLLKGEERDWSWAICLRSRRMVTIGLGSAWITVVERLWLCVLGDWQS
jgi:hypothetical protein